MSHSHLALQHLIRKIESPEYQKSRPAGPTWLADFVDRVAELFEPFVDLGRVGFECRPGVERWEIAMYLGQTELVGGREDGQMRAVAFQFDLLALTRLFDRITSLRWNAFPASLPTEGDHQPEWSFVSVIGVFADAELRLKVFGTPPDEVGPGMRQRSDGSWEPV